MTLDERSVPKDLATSTGNHELPPEIKFEEGTFEAGLIEEGRDLMPSASERYYVDGSSLPSKASLSNESLVHTIQRRVAMCQLVSPLAYMTSRDDYLAASFELNERGLLAPAFRPTPMIPPPTLARERIHMIIQRDRIVIDAHWLFCRGERPVASETKWLGLISETEMDWDLVSDFAAAKIKNDYRANAILGLTVQTQCQLSALRGKIVQDRFKQIVASDMTGSIRIPPRYEIVRLCINRWCELDRRMVKHAAKYLAYAKASELLGEFARVSEISRLAAFITGTPALSDRTASAVIKKLDAKVQELCATVYSGPSPRPYLRISSGTSSKSIGL
jgi:hypothetical protein